MRIHRNSSYLETSSIWTEQAWVKQGPLYFIFPIFFLTSEQILIIHVFVNDFDQQMFFQMRIPSGICLLDVIYY